jgi:hypothetical protein
LVEFSKGTTARRARPARRESKRAGIVVWERRAEGVELPEKCLSAA